MNRLQTLRLPRIIELYFEKGGPPGFHRSAGCAEICTKPLTESQCRKLGKPRSSFMPPAAEVVAGAAAASSTPGGPIDYCRWAPARITRSLSQGRFPVETLSLGDHFLARTRPLAFFTAA